MDKPHIIYILSYEHRGQTMNRVGDPNVEMPWMDHLAPYYAMSENINWNIGCLNPCLQSQLSFAHTLQIYSSDHGDYMGSHGVFNTKEYPHTESVYIPAIFHWPDQLPAQELVEGLFSLIDLMAITIGLADCDVPVWSQSCNWSPHLCSEVFDELLYDLDADSFKQRNRACNHPAECVRQRERLLALLHQNYDPYWDILVEHGVACDHEIVDISPRPLRCLDYLDP